MKTSARIERVAIYETTPFVEEKLASLFQPDTLLPAEYLETTCRKAHLEPEKKLMLAVLKDAIDCFQDNALAQGGKKKKRFGEAEEWILADNNDWLFSFENICEALGFNPQYVRQGLMRWKEVKLARRPKANIYRFVSQGGRKEAKLDNPKGMQGPRSRARLMVTNRSNIQRQPRKEKDHADGKFVATDTGCFNSCPNYIMDRGMRHGAAETRQVALRAAR